LEGARDKITSLSQPKQPKIVFLIFALLKVSIFRLKIVYLWRTQLKVY